MEKGKELQHRERSTGLIATIKSPEKFREMERGLTVEKIVENSIPIAALKQTIPYKEIAQALDIQLTRLVGSLNLKWNLQDEQIKVIVEDLLDKYPNESLEDFTLVFKKARTGCFKDKDGDSTIYRLDSAIIFSWMEQHLEEKYRVLESKLREEKDEFFKPVKPVAKSESHQKWLDKLKEAVDGIQSKKTVPLTKDEIRREGQPKPVDFKYNTDQVQALQILIQGEMHRIAYEGYKHVDPVDKLEFQLFTVAEIYKVNAANQEDANTIYREAKGIIDNQFKR